MALMLMARKREWLKELLKVVRKVVRKVEQKVEQKVNFLKVWKLPVTCWQLVCLGLKSCN